jgi:predicted TPR repeat methyltransferase
MLATITADASMQRASNKYVKNLFDDYAQKWVKMWEMLWLSSESTGFTGNGEFQLTHHSCSFEHSLVQELGYTGYERLRRGFDRAFGGQESVPKFSLVVDAGCGTGLVGEQVRDK